MSQEEFFKQCVNLLQQLTPERDFADLRPDTHLWIDGYLDSLALLDVITFVEELVGEEIVLDGNFLPTFFTIENIYSNYVADAVPA